MVLASSVECAARDAKRACESYSQYGENAVTVLPVVPKTTFPYHANMSLLFRRLT